MTCLSSKTHYFEYFLYRHGLPMLILLGFLFPSISGSFVISQAASVKLPYECFSLVWQYYLMKLTGVTLKGGLMYTQKYVYFHC